MMSEDHFRGKEESFSLFHMQLPLLWLHFSVQNAVFNPRCRHCTKMVVRMSCMMPKGWKHGQLTLCRLLHSQNQHGSVEHHWIQKEEGNNEAQYSHIWKKSMKTFHWTPDLACKHPDCIGTVSNTLGFGRSRDQKITLFFFLGRI